MLTLFQEEVDHGIQIAGSIKFRHLRGRLQAQIDDSQPSNSTAGCVEKCRLDVDTLVFGQFVVVLYLDGNGLVAIYTGQFHVSCVGHVHVPVEICRPDAGRGAHTHNRIECDRTAYVVDDICH